ncbi:MAG: EAL domain-containing protein [Gammaproteobacteria bacterium]|nr:EAL domain-containing protein [Gammaproteobacteria bacterium]MDH4310597.1 EAL domain-containing protein [Gammaproteobacteria bacterium]MDH5272629.1 EAL domain-containing protein [Gammaproteobacteria bacterium]
MVGPELKLRYVFAVLTVGALLTAGVAAVTRYDEAAEREELRTVDAQLDAIAALDPRIAAAHEQLQGIVEETYDDRTVNVAIAGALLTLMAALVVLLLMMRIDRALVALMDNAQSIGRGRYAKPVAVSGVAEVAELERSLEQMRQALTTTTISRDFLDDVLNGIKDAVLVMTTDGRMRTANAAAADLFGVPGQELIGVAFKDLIAPEHLAAFSLERLQQAPGETVIRTQRGQTIPVSVHISSLGREPAGGNRGTILVLRDITERKRAERRIRYLARYDTLTKMPNRMQFQHQLHQAITRNTRQGRGLVLLYIDIDNFKEINDTFGHDTGDRVLETISERLTRALPRESVAGRLAGDEFAVFAEGIHGEQAGHEQGHDLARLVLGEIARPVHLPGQEIDVTASIGVALVPEHADNVIDLIRNADAAMYHAKRQGRNCHVFYVPEMNAAAVERLLLKSKLRRALERDEFVLRYQPKVDLASGEVVGSEALLRWRLPGHGEIAPSQFIPLAEESRLILDIGAWVLNQVCTDYAAWQQRVSDPGRVAINLSLKELSQASFIPRCRSVFERHNVPASCVELEITETTLMLDAERTLPLLDELRSMGIHLSIDDFGTGYSSLSALQQFPISTLKIDRSFVTNAATDPDDATIVRTIIEMGRSLGLQVLAEGIETEEQRYFLLHSGCQMGQGRLFGDAISSDAFLELLLRQATGDHPVLQVQA